MSRYIDLDKLNEYPIRLNHYDKENGNINFVYGIESVLEYANSIACIEQLCDPEPLYWETWAGDLLKCPACKHEYTDAVECTNFCGNCGAPLQFKKDGNQNEVF